MKKITYYLILAFVLASTAVLNAQTTYTSVASGPWSVPGNWSPSGIPAQGDYVIISKTITITGSHEIAGFTLGWPGRIEFGGANPSLTVTGNSTWNSGVIDGGNSANGGNAVNNTLLLTETSVLTLKQDPANPWYHLYEGTNMINRGTIILQGSGKFGGRGLSVLHNEGLFDIQTDADFGGESFSGATFINTGTLRKSGGTDVTSINSWWTFENQNGIIDVQTGTLEHTGSGTYANGTYTIAENAMLTFTGGIWVLSGSLNGNSAGIFSLNGPTFDTDSLSVTYNIQGSEFQFVDGTITGGGTLIIAEDNLMVLPGLDYAGLSGGTSILNEGTIKMYGSQYFSMTGGTTIDNRSLFEISSDADMQGGNGGSTFLNTGILRKSGGSDATVFSGTMNFYNMGGTVDVQTGTLEFTASGSLENGAYNIAVNAFLNLKAGIQILKGTLNGTSAGTFSLNGADINTDNVAVTLNIMGNGFNWVRGDLTGGGTLIIPEGVKVNITGTDYAGISGETTLKNMGTLTLGGTTRFTAQYSSIIDNRSRTEINSDNDFYAINGGGTFINTGTLIKNGGLDKTSFSSQWYVINKTGGVIDAASGEFEFANLVNDEGGIIQGNAAIKVPSNFTNNGITSPGHSPGILTYNGDFRPSATAAFNVELGGLTAGTEYDQLLVTGKAILGGALNISLVNGFIPKAGDSFEFLVTTAAVSDTFAEVSVTPGLYIDVQIQANKIIMVVDSVSSSLSVGEGQAVTGFELSQNYPNPFYSTTTIKVEIGQQAGVKKQEVSLKVYNSSGIEVANLIDPELSPGIYEVTFDGSLLPAGIYFYKLTRGNFSSSKKMVRMR